MEITINISRSAVLREVGNTTSYIGLKMDNEAAIDRIPTVDEDDKMLLRFWNESRAEVVKTFIRILHSEGMNDGDDYELNLNVTERFNRALVPSMESGLFSFFVNNIVGLWCMYTNKEEAMAYIERGRALLEDVQEKGYYEKIHTRPMSTF